MRRTKKTSMKRITSVLLSAAMLLSSVQSVFAAVSIESFTDFPTGWSKPAMEAAVDNGLLAGFENNEIRPKNNLTRAEIAAIISRAFGAVTMADISAFHDVEYNAWYYESVAKAVQMGAMSGKSTTEMCPNDNITREEAFSVVGRILALSDNDTSVLSKFHDAANVSSWAAGNIAALVRRGYVNGDALGYLNPKANITREEFAQFMYITIKRYITQPGTYSGEMQGIVVLRTGNVNLTNLTVNGDLVVGDGAMKLAVNLNNVTVNGRFLTRGGVMTLKNTTVTNGVVVLNPNGITPFNNYSSENVFNGITEITKPSFLPGTAISSGGGGGSVATQYYVTFKLNASDTDSYARFKVAKGRTIGSNMPANPAKVGYTFEGWFDANGNEVTADTRVTGTLNVTARFLPIQYNIVFKNDDDTPFSYFVDGYSPSNTFNIETTYILPTADKVYRRGYAFAGWVDADGNPVTSVSVTENTPDAGLVLYPRWTANEYELVLDAQFRDGTSPRVITYTIENYSSIVLPNETEVVIPSGMSSFLGWYKADGTRVTALDESFITATVGRITLTARFSPEVATNYDVTFKLNASDSNNYASFSVQGGSTIGSRMPTVPTKLGYTFAGWYANGVEITAATIVNANINAVARWTANEYELVLDAQFREGASPRVLTYTIENYRTIVLPGEDDLVIPSGMSSFLGWYKADGTRVTALDESFITATVGSITLTAKFREEVIEPIETITVSFYLGYGDYEVYLEERELELNSEGIAQMTEAQVPSYPTAGTDVFRKRTYMKTDYPDYDGVYRVTPTFWYEVGGKLVPFEAPVELTRDTKVYLLYQNFALNASVSELPDAAISSKYNENTRLMDSAKVMGDGAVNWLNLAKMYPKYTEFVDLGIGALVDRDIMDENRNLKMLYLPIKISQVTTEDVANGMVRTKIRNMISNPAELDELLGMADIDDLISYIDKDNVIANLTDEQILTLMKASENRTMVTNFIVSDLQSSHSALMDTVLSYISSSLETNPELRASLVAQLKTKLAGNDASAKNLRKLILHSDSFKTLLSNESIEETVINMILDTESGIIDVILSDSDLAKTLISEISSYPSFINTIINTSEFKNYVLPLIQIGGAEYEDVTLKILGSDVAKRQILDAVEDNPDFKDIVRNNSTVRSEILESITVDENEIIKFLFDLEGATDYTYIIGAAKVAEVRGAIESAIIAEVGGQYIYDMMTDEQKYQARENAYADPVVYAQIRTRVIGEINAYKESILDDFIDGNLTDDDIINMIENKMIVFVRNYVDKEESLNDSIAEVIEANIIDYVYSLITGPVPTDPDLADVKRKLDDAVDTFIENAHTNTQLIQVVKNYINTHSSDSDIISAINDVYDELIPTIASYVNGLDTTSANYAAIDTALKNAANTLDTTVLSNFIKDNSANDDILAILEQYIADPDNENDIIGYIGDFIGTLDVSFVHNNRTLIDDMLSALDIEDIIGNDPDRAVQLIKDYIATLDANGKIDLADEIYSQIVVTVEYRSLIEHMFQMDEIVVTPDNMVFVKAISLAIRALSVEEALEFTNNQYIEKLINFVGEDFITGRFNETRDRYCDGLDEVIETVESGASTRGTYTTSLRFRVNPVEDILLKLYNKAQPVAEEKLSNANIHYEDNEYLQYIVKHDVIDRLLIGDGTVNGEFIGYAIKDEVEYAKYVMELLIAADDALCWYGDDANLTDEQVDAIVNAAVTKARIVHSKINDVLEDYMATGDLPAQIEQLLSSVQKVNDMFLKVEPKLRTIIDRYLTSRINDKIQNGNIVENDKVQTGLDILIGREDPVFTIDCLYDIFYKYDDKVQAKLKQLVDSGKLRSAIDKAFEKVYATDAITNRVDAEKLEKLEEFADQLYAVLVNIANNGIDAYKVNTDGNPTIIDQYHLTIGENEFTMTRSLQ